MGGRGQHVQGTRALKRMVALLEEVAKREAAAAAAAAAAAGGGGGGGGGAAAQRELSLRFLRSPCQLIEDPARPGWVGGVRLERMRLEGAGERRRAVGTGEHEVLPAALLLRSVGYRSLPIPGAPPSALTGLGCGCGAVWVWW